MLRLPSVRPSASSSLVALVGLLAACSSSSSPGTSTGNDAGGTHDGFAGKQYLAPVQTSDY